MYEFDITRTYRLVDVRDHDGNSKAETKDLYTAERFAVRESTKEIYFRGSHLRHGNPTDHKKPDIKLSDFLLDHEDQ